MECIPGRMAGQGRRQGTLSSIELLPEAFVIAAQMAKKSWGLALPILPALATNGEGKASSQHPDVLRIMPHGVSELSPHLLALLIKIGLATPLTMRRPAAIHMLAASHLS
jgi:hypothetical protein